MGWKTKNWREARTYSKVCISYYSWPQPASPPKPSTTMTTATSHVLTFKKPNAVCARLHSTATNSNNSARRCGPQQQETKTGNSCTVWNESGKSIGTIRRNLTILHCALALDWKTLFPSTRLLNLFSPFKAVRRSRNEIIKKKTGFASFSPSKLFSTDERNRYVSFPQITFLASFLIFLSFSRFSTEFLLSALFARLS